MKSLITIVDYNPNWPSYYREESKSILHILGEYVESIDHIGSTSIQGLGGDGSIDILVGVRSIEDFKTNCIPRLESLGYKQTKTHIEDTFDNCFFVKSKADGSIFHLYLTEKEDRNWKRKIAFRDYLKKNGFIAKEYESLKIKLATCCISYDEYIKAKASFIKIIEKRISPGKPISCQIKKVNCTTDQKDVIKYLLPNEMYSLFLIGNLNNKDFSSDYYVAMNDEKIVGVSAYFSVFKSFSLFTEYPEVSRELVRFSAKKHPIKSLLGMADCSREAFDEFLRLGYQMEGNPKFAYMELDLDNFKYFDVNEGYVVPIEEKDLDQVAMLNRVLSHQSLNLPVTEEERNRIRFNPIKYCLKVDERVVSSAVSNGIVNNTFQILAVATLPEYRRRGFAKTVCSHLIRNFIEKENPKRAVLTTSYDNISAQKIYHDLGFKISDEYYFVDFRQ